LFSITVIEFIRSRLLLYISTRINISLLSNFWAKLLRLPLHFFESKHPGDILQRIGDHHRIEAFLTGSALNTLISVFSLVIFSVVMISYNVKLFVIFAVGSIIYILWIRLFLKYRRQLDNRRFYLAAKENNTTMQLVYGIQEIKLNNAELTYRRTWENLQAGLFTLNFKGLSLNQYQQAGAFFINQGKNFLITYLVAKLVINQELSFGMMMAVQYILGQLNAPVEQLIGFVQQAQDAKISVERLNDIHKLKNEVENEEALLHTLPEDHSIIINNLTFSYPGSDNAPVLKSLSLEIPHGKVVAIVGMSGSGKTTLIKMLLKFYYEYEGSIAVDQADLNSISPDFWRSKCGVVMQDSFIFNDSIERNITVTEDPVDIERLENACRTANILSFIESLPLGFQTRIGADGYNLSGGQRQRLSIARAVYKNPEYFFKGKTVVVVAHRLSTVKNADKIVVMDNGQIAEEGTHEILIRQKGQYFELVKNQLELDM
jgi:ATP-binding cassette, subfamily B, bacterial